MPLIYLVNGNLEAGIHPLSLNQLIAEFGYTAQRMELLGGLEMAARDLKAAGCSKIFIDGSFVTKKYQPGDYDACWSEQGVDIGLLKQQSPLFFDFGNQRARQKAYYKGEWFPASFPAQINPFVYYLNFFQRDRDDSPKGIIEIVI